MANPPDSYEVYTTAISAAAISTQIKTIESKLGLQARPQAPPAPWCCVHLLYMTAQTALQSTPSHLVKRQCRRSLHALAVQC